MTLCRETLTAADRVHCPVCQYEAPADEGIRRCPNGPPLRQGGTAVVPGPRTAPFDFYAHECGCLYCIVASGQAPNKGFGPLHPAVIARLKALCKVAQ